MKEMNGNQKETAKKQHKYLIIGLCSVALLGSGLTYAALNQGEKKEAQTEQQGTKPKEERQTPKSKQSPWERKVTENEEKNKDKDKKIKSKQPHKTKDSLAEVVSGFERTKEEKPKLFGVEIPEIKSDLLGQLANALVQQDRKEAIRETNKKEKQRETILALANEKTASEPMEKLPGKIDTTDKLLLPEKPVIPDKPLVPNEPNLPVVPEVPDQPVDPEQPTKPTVSELIKKSQDQLVAATQKARNINHQLEDVQKRLTQLTQVEELSKNGEETTNYWSEVAHLVDEYNQLSEQIKTLVSENNEVEEINAALYNQTYQQLKEKVVEVHNAQEKANQATNDFENKVSNATKTHKNLENLENHYEETLQPQAEQAKETVGAAIDEAQTNTEVAVNVQTEVAQAEAAAVAVQNNQEKISQQLVVAKSQETLSEVQDTSKEVKEIATTQNQAVVDVQKDFTHLPQPIKDQPKEPETVSDSMIDTTAQKEETEVKIDEPTNQMVETPITNQEK
ncbi:cell surface protein [Enterococcus faecalis]|nr:cell surface protein [Enterococcus faecalis]MBG9436567.1 cell surface protein [Enterococcus faecalis]MBG9439339.1 cell surface protein [Enterococcus faecalis]MBG9442121.1 cell surface protein [Enterococcus faecalis]NRE00687.1 cell surface protein [Enterococcus faecalis]